MSTEFDLLTRLRFALGDPDSKLTASQLTRRAHEVRQKADRWDEWHEAQYGLETTMPQGWRFVIDCSPGDWSLALLDPDGNRVDFDNDCDSIAQMMRNAIARAREKAGVLTDDDIAKEAREFSKLDFPSESIFRRSVRRLIDTAHSLFIKGE